LLSFNSALKFSSLLYSSSVFSFHIFIIPVFSSFYAKVAERWVQYVASGGKER